MYNTRIANKNPKFDVVRLFPQAELLIRSAGGGDSVLLPTGRGCFPGVLSLPGAALIFSPRGYFPFGQKTSLPGAALFLEKKCPKHA
jgi:hypothetical protein